MGDINPDVYVPIVYRIFEAALVSHHGDVDRAAVHVWFTETELAYVYPAEFRRSWGRGKYKKQLVLDTIMAYYGLYKLRNMLSAYIPCILPQVDTPGRYDSQMSVYNNQFRIWTVYPVNTEQVALYVRHFMLILDQQGHLLPLARYVQPLTPMYLTSVSGDLRQFYYGDWLQQAQNVFLSIHHPYKEAYGG